MQEVKDSVNFFVGRGVVHNLSEGKTKLGHRCCNFILQMPNEKYVTRIRCNLFGRIVDYCLEKIVEGSYVILQGEIMNRKPKDTPLALVEIRCHDIRLISPDKGNID